MASTGLLTYSEIIPTNKTHKTKKPTQNQKQTPQPRNQTKQKTPCKTPTELTYCKNKKKKNK